jgi:hypothetical protein
MEKTPPDALQATTDPTVRVLFVAANPTDATRLAVGEEHREIDARIQRSRARDAFELSYAPEVRVDDLMNVLLRHRPTILHFSGHGDDGALLLAGPDGQSARVEPDALSALVAAVAPGLALRCVVLNACHSAPLAEALRPHVDRVIGVPGDLRDLTAVAFAGSFYEAIGFGCDVDRAFEIALAQVGLTSRAGGALPTLHRRDGSPVGSVQLLPVTTTPTSRVATGAKWLAAAALVAGAVGMLLRREPVFSQGREGERAVVDAGAAGEAPTPAATPDASAVRDAPATPAAHSTDVSADARASGVIREPPPGHAAHQPPRQNAAAVPPSGPRFLSTGVPNP